MIKAVAFDLDGTLIDSTEPIVESFFHTFAVIGEPAPAREAITTSIGYTLPQQFALFAKHDPEDCTRIYRNHYERIMCDRTFLLPGAEDCLKRLKAAGLRIGFATSKKRESSEAILEHLGVLHYFESRLGPDDVTHPKPHPEAVLTSLERLGAQADEMFFIGDTHFDVIAARNANVRCLCVSTGYNTHEELVALEPEQVFTNLTDLTGYALTHRE